MDVEEKEFEELLFETRHQEILNTLKTIAGVLSEKKDDAVEKALQKHTKAIEGLVSAIKAMPKPNISINQDEVVASVHQMCEKILTGLSDLKKCIEEKPMVHEFRLEEDGFTRSRVVKVIYKPTSEILLKATKYGIN